MSKGYLCWVLKDKKFAWQNTKDIRTEDILQSLGTLCVFEGFPSLAVLTC